MVPRLYPPPRHLPAVFPILLLLLSLRARALAQPPPCQTTCAISTIRTINGGRAGGPDPCTAEDAQAIFASCLASVSCIPIDAVFSDLCPGISSTISELPPSSALPTTTTRPSSEPAQPSTRLSPTPIHTPSSTVPLSPPGPLPPTATEQVPPAASSFIPQPSPPTSLSTTPAGPKTAGTTAESSNHSALIAAVAATLFALLFLEIAFFAWMFRTGRCGTARGRRRRRRRDREPADDGLAARAASVGRRSGSMEMGVLRDPWTPDGGERARGDHGEWELPVPPVPIVPVLGAEHGDQPADSDAAVTGTDVATAEAGDAAVPIEMAGAGEDAAGIIALRGHSPVGGAWCEVPVVKGKSYVHLWDVRIEQTSVDFSPRVYSDGWGFGLVTKDGTSQCGFVPLHTLQSPDSPTITWVLTAVGSRSRSAALASPRALMLLGRGGARAHAKEKRDLCLRALGSGLLDLTARNAWRQALNDVGGAPLTALIADDTRGRSRKGMEIASDQW
ncbi:hypothetical protein BDK51DRAFT_42977 [Blyttiomyces helicus]|uniref:Uncharacterized protein n=1 Tax=Blyttiomyces helicus TaxID=388810 RepID=A0A4V1IRI4_9FUNG|nr:hypothetical protein BDK51DRAFT_42977 [Blyttiomyces helicus]|eukprot:RKO90167.1 hypothetical protein BDK51DRAFT_42977 [Blyttiomyces helicus]